MWKIFFFFLLNLYILLIFRQGLTQPRLISNLLVVEDDPELILIRLLILLPLSLYNWHLLIRELELDILSAVHRCFIFFLSVPILCPLFY